MRIIVVLLLSLQGVAAWSQTGQKTPLRFRSSLCNLTVDPSEGLIVTTRAGEVAMTASIDENWELSPPVNSSEQFQVGVTIDQANFFNSDTGFVSGFIKGTAEKYNIIYHTVDKGKNWKAIDFGQDGWVDDAVSLDNGEAWLSVSGSGLAYTTDFGFSWKKIPLPETKQRYAKIFFNPARQGIVGSLWNRIAYTADNGTSWTMLPTPLDQNKYTKTNKQARPEIAAVAIYKNYFLVQQEEFVFYSRRDSIDWILLPSYKRFFTDPSNTALFFSSSSQLIRSGDSLLPLSEVKASLSNYTATCRNGSLFAFDGSEVLQVRADNSVFKQGVFTKQPESMTPTIIGYMNNLVLGHTGNMLYIQEGASGQWTFLNRMPFPVGSGSFSIAEDERILYSFDNDSLIYYQYQTGQVYRTTVTKLLSGFTRYPVQKMIFQTGSRGCFHFTSMQRDYRLDGGQFVYEEPLPVRRLPGKKRRSVQPSPPLPGPEGPLPATALENFLQQLPSIINEPATITDLNFSASDFERCRSDIREFRRSITTKSDKEPVFFLSKNNIDFNRLISLVDSVPLVNAQQLKAYIESGGGFFSTTVNWHSFSLINSAGEILSFSHSYSTDHPHLYNLPWQITIDGYSTYSTQPAISKFIQDLFPAFIQTDKRELLNFIVQQLYRNE